MRIAYLVSQYPAPSHTFISREVAELRRQGLEIHTFSVRPAGETKYGKQVDPSTFYLLPFRPLYYLWVNLIMFLWAPVPYVRTFWLALQHRVPGVKPLALSVCYFLEAMVFANELRRRRINHVHNHFANPAATVSMLATRFLKLTWSLTLHGHSEFDYPAGNLLAAKLEECDFAVCISNFGRAQAYRILDPKHWHKLFISRCGVDLERLPGAPRRTPGAPLRIISVARLAPEKGHHGLIQAFAQARYAANCELVLVGDGPERAALERQVKGLKLEKVVTFKGALPEEETLREIAASDILVLASFMEGLPVVLMEAMALRKPVIAPNLTGIPDLVRDQENGMLFIPADWDSLADRLELVLSAPALRSQLGQAGYKSIQEGFAIEMAVAPLRQRFSQLVVREIVDDSWIRASELT